MAWLKYDRVVKRLNSDAFDTLFEPGIEAPYAGIYECAGCGREIGIAEGHRLPPQNHHQHQADEGKVRWLLIVYADHRHANEQGRSP